MRRIAIALVIVLGGALAFRSALAGSQIRVPRWGVEAHGALSTGSARFAGWPVATCAWPFGPQEERAAAASAVAQDTRRGAAGHPGIRRGAAGDPARFVALDVFVDSGATALGAYQFEYVGAGDDVEVKLVGVEGGEAAPFAGAPHYDPKALAGGRVVVGAFSTARGLPSGRTRVARLHLVIEGAIEGADADDDAAAVRHMLRLVTAGDGAAAAIDATISYQEVEAP